VTLELALLNIPTVVEFAIRPLDLFIARRLLRINLPHYCLVNIIANEQVFPELFGPYCTPALIAREALALLSTPSPVHAGMQKVKKLLGTRASSLAAARAILSTLPHMMD
jgi:lipid-A-disaccharide synthase